MPPPGLSTLGSKFVINYHYRYFQNCFVVKKKLLYVYNLFAPSYVHDDATGGGARCPLVRLFDLLLELCVDNNGRDTANTSIVGVVLDALGETPPLVTSSSSSSSLSSSLSGTTTIASTTVASSTATTTTTTSVENVRARRIALYECARLAHCVLDVSFDIMCFDSNSFSLLVVA